jgi:protein-S-isoprenylcysteine O-methyltransferase Ste14
VFLRALASFLVLPGVVAGLVPPMLAAADPWRGGGWSVGVAVLAVGLFVLLWTVRDFYVAGKGTLAPWDPPKHLVIVGLYRYTRNPMYVGVIILVAGWALRLGSPVLAGYMAVLMVAFHLRVVMAEEPWLQRQFGDAWSAYSAEVPRWFGLGRPRPG